MSDGEVTRSVAVRTRPWVHPVTGVVRHCVANVPELIGLDVDYYRTGSVKDAQLQGRQLSNTEGRRLLGMIRDMRVWRDDRGVFHAYTGADAQVLTPRQVMEQLAHEVDR